MRIAIYCRVSTDKQSHDLQLAELREYCTRRGWTQIEEFMDTISGSKFSRLALDRMMTLVRKGKIDVVLCFRLDRLGRSLGHLAQLIAEFQSARVALIVPGQGIDTSSNNPAATLQLNILGAIAQFERELIRERVIAGISAAKANGVKFGRAGLPDAEVAKVRALLAQGLSVRAVAEQSGISKSVVGRISKQQAPAAAA